MTTITSVIQRLAWLALLGLAISLPFELVQPWVNIGPLVFTNLELAAALTMLVWACGCARLRRVPHWPSWLWRPLLAWGLVLMASALLAPAERAAALKFALRSLVGVASGLMVYDLLLNAGPTRCAARMRSLAWAFALGAAGAALLGCAEVLWPTLTAPWLSAFKLQTTRVAGAIRASGSFGYANIAAQAWEAALVLLITLWATTRPRRLQALIGFAIVIISSALVLTASRGGLVAILATSGWLLIAGWWVQRRARQRPPGLPQSRSPSLPRAAGVTFMTVFLLAGIQLALSPVQQARLQREVETGVMQAEYAAPAHLTLVAGQRTQAPVRITNRGQLPWRASGAEPILLSYHWLDVSQETILWFEGDRTVLPGDVPPGASMLVSAYVLAPAQPGRYVLAWDLLQNHVAWFSTRGVPLGHTEVEVMAGAAPLPVQPLPPPLPASALTAAQNRGQVARMTLWKAAWQLWRQHPWLGVGPDNFRFLWGDALGLVDWRPVGQPPVLHSNSLYVEILATLGLAGVIAFAWLLLSLARRVFNLLARLPASTAVRDATAFAEHDLTWLLGLSATVMVFLIHGIFDYFLEFTPTYLLWWLAIGSLAACITETEERLTDAHRL